MRIQISYCLYPQISAQRAVWSNQTRLWRRVFHSLTRQREARIEEGHIMPDHVHMLISIPPKFSVSQVVGYIKGKSAIRVARRFINRGRNFTGCNFWARGYFVSTVGCDEEIIRAYIKNQESLDQQQDRQL